LSTKFLQFVTPVESALGSGWGREARAFQWLKNHWILAFAGMTAFLLVIRRKVITSEILNPERDSF